ncbi:MAG: DNA polymerase III subunit chi [Alphaproteobacteria bacterium]|nr:DNA polymerase III subunit chi [Alphaproteobacteria bacterium]
MPEVRFYHLQNKSEAYVLPVILSKALERGHKIVIKLADQNMVAKYNDLLWTHHPDSFLPHGSEKDGNAALQPVYLTDKDENPNGADVLVLCEGTHSEIHDQFDLYCEMLNGRNERAVKDARSRWKTYKEKGYDVTYWQETPNGGWEKKA